MADRKRNADAAFSRTGGVYVPPFKLARLRKKIDDQTSPEFQRQAWEALRKSLNGLVNKVTKANITNIVQDLFKENLIRGRGLVARAILRAQLASPGFTHIYAALLAVINSKLPEIGLLVINRLLLQFRRAYRRNDKIICNACVKLIAHLVNQRVAHELLALQLAALLLEKATDDSVEVCVTFMQECGKVLYDITPQGFNAIFERFRGILHEGSIDKRVQYTIEKLFEARRSNFAEFPGVLEELDLIEEDDQITHEVDLLAEDIKQEEMLDIFHAVPAEQYVAEDTEWKRLSNEILGIEDDEADEDRGGGSESDGAGSDSESSADSEAEEAEAKRQEIHDMTEQDLINLRKTIYLCIMSSLSCEECVHKLLKLNIKPGWEIEVCTMLIDCCAMERTFLEFFPLQAERLCRLQEVYQTSFTECFNKQYATIHRLETNKLRNTAKFFAHLLHTDALPWSILETFNLTAETTTSASRIFIKIVFLELAAFMGLEKLKKRLNEPDLQPYLKNLFHRDHPAHIRFSINFFTAIGLGALTDDLRQLHADSMRKS